MDEPLILNSARKHDVLDEDILHALRNAFSGRADDEGFTMWTGLSRSGHLIIEVGTVEREGVVVIVHAMTIEQQR